MRRLMIMFLIGVAICALITSFLYSNYRSLRDIRDRILDLYNNRSPIVLIRHTYNVDQTACILPNVYEAADITWTNPNRWSQDDTQQLTYDARFIDGKVVRIEVDENQILIDSDDRVWGPREMFEGKYFTLQCEVVNKE